MSVTDAWRPKRPGPASDRDNVTRQTLRAGIHAPPPEIPYVIIGGLQNSDDMALERESVTYANVRSVSAETMRDTLNCSVQHTFGPTGVTRRLDGANKISNVNDR